jgi:VanZ family protein
MDLPQTNIITFRLALLASLAVVMHLATTKINYPVIENMNDKVNHIFAFYVLGFLADFSFPRNKLGLSKVLPLLGFGLLIEVIQYFLPYRSFSLYDLAADAAGLAAYWASLPALKHFPLLRRRWNIEARKYG